MPSFFSFAYVNKVIIPAMDIFFTDPNEIPLPPGEVRIKELQAEPWANGEKIRIYLEVAPSQKRPSAELSLTNPQGEIISTINVVESMTRKIEVNMHLRSKPIPGKYTLNAILYFDELEPETETEQDPLMKHHQVDTASINFTYDASSESP